jgi:hypothetical protein
VPRNIREDGIRQLYRDDGGKAVFQNSRAYFEKTLGKSVFTVKNRKKSEIT